MIENRWSDWLRGSQFVLLFGCCILRLLLWRAVLLANRQRLFLWICLWLLFRRTVWRIFVKDIEFLPSTNSLDFILSRWRSRFRWSTYHSISMLRSKVVYSIVAIWHFTQRELPYRHVLPGARLILSNRYRVFRLQVSICSRQSNIIIIRMGILIDHMLRCLKGRFDWVIYDGSIFTLVLLLTLGGVIDVFLAWALFAVAIVH